MGRLHIITDRIRVKELTILVKKRHRIPKDMLIMLIITELFAAVLCCSEIEHTTYSQITDARLNAIIQCLSDSDFSKNKDLTKAAARGKKAYKKKKREERIAYEEAHRWKGPVLSRSRGAIIGPSGKETYYNLNMSGVVSIMRNMGYSEEYWVRDDGCKMLGDYIMVAANLSLRPRGSIVETSLGKAIVCDTGGFAKHNPTQIDIATTW